MRALRHVLPFRFAVAFVLIQVGIAEAQTSSMRATVPAPTAASLGKFGDVPVSLYTGIPDISIPLFTVKGRTLELPVTLRYHAGGIKVEEISGWAGLGWTLEAGGTITRTVRGIADEEPSGYYNTGHVFYSGQNWENPPTTLLQNIHNKSIDGEPDRFFFSFAGRSGQFAMGPTTSSPSIKEYRSAPHERLQIVPTITGSGITQWQITVEDGTRYTFGAAEQTADFTAVSTPESDAPSHYGEAFNSSWHLTEIRSPGGDIINFYYSQYTVRHRQGTYTELFSSIGHPQMCAPASYDVVGEYETYVQRLDSIKSAAHTLRFASSLRSDALSPAGVQQERKLDRITVFSSSGVQLRRFQFDHDYYPGNRLRLKSVAEQDANGISLAPHTFTYDPQTLPVPTSKAQDHWGFYNGVANSSLIPTVMGPWGYPLLGGDRNPSVSHIKAGSLTRITYPTGGYSEFVYEANDYGAIAGGGAIIEEGPIQGAQLSSSGGQGQQSTQFTIGGTQPVFVDVVVSTEPEVCFEAEGICPWVEIVGHVTYNESAAFSITLAPGTYTLHASDEWRPDASAQIQVKWRNKSATTKKTGGGLRVAKIRTADGMGQLTTRRYKYRLYSDTTKSSGVIHDEPRYHYTVSGDNCGHFSRSSMSRIQLGTGLPIGYKEVTVWHGPNAEFGKTRYTFNYAHDPAPTAWPFASRDNYSWMGGRQTGATEYNSAGQVQRRTSTSYTTREAAADSAKSFRGLSLNVFTAGWNGLQYQSDYVYQQFRFVSAWMHPAVDSTFIHNETGGSSFSTSTTYTYGNAVHLQPTQITETNSDGMQRVTRMKYPADYASGTGDQVAEAITSMKGPAHMHAQVIERWIVERIGGVEAVVRGDLTTFKLYPGIRILPFQRFILNSPEPVQ